MGAYQIEWKKTAIRELKRIDRSAIPRIIKAVDELSFDPLPQGVVKLQGSQHTYRVRIGDYRVIYDLYEAVLVIEVIRVRHRKEAYR